MNRSPSTDRTRTVAVAFAAGAALLCASLVNFLHHNEYPLVRPEVGLIVAALLAIAAPVALFYSAQRQWGRSFLEGLLAALFVDLNADSVALACAVGAAVALFTWWRRTSLAGPMAVVGVVVIATTMLGLGGKPQWIKVQRGAQAASPSGAVAGKPAIVHIVLDEHIGLEGLQNEGVNGRRLGNELRAFYLANGFATYGGAYSQYYNTTNAIPVILNYGQRLAAKASRKGAVVGSTRHLQALVAEGYKLTVIQSDFVDFCSTAVFYECLTYDSASLRPTMSVPMGVADRAGLIASKFLRLSEFVHAITIAWNVAAVSLRGAGLSLLPYEPNPGQSSAVASLEAMHELTARLKSARPGDLIFAHMLLPHYPYVVRSNCTYLPWKSWEGRYAGSTVESRRRASYQQIRCTALQLQSLLRALEQSPAGRNVVVIVHGDHGSRIVRVSPQVRNLGAISDSDMIAGFSTLFAVRGPGIEAGYYTQRMPVGTLLHEFANSGFRAAPHPQPPREHFIYLADSDWKPARRVPLPQSWLAEESRPKLAHPAAGGVSH